MITSEVRKYSLCYQDPSYRMERRRMQWVRRDIDSIPFEATYLDVGCGRGESIDYALSRKLTAFGIEIVPELCNEHVLNASVTNIPFERVDYVSCYDMLEHLPPNEVEQALDELFRVAEKGLFLTVSGNESVKDGMTLHLSVHDKDWWFDQFRLRWQSHIVCSTYKTERDWHFAIW